MMGPTLMIVVPEWWIGLVLGLASYRLTRLLGWDTFPAVARLRDLATGASTVTSGSFNSRNRMTPEPVEVTIVHRRPWLYELLSCPFCSGWWISLGLYVAWRLEPSWTLAACVPLALSAFVGLVARNLDYS